MAQPLPLDVSSENYATVALQDDATAAASAPVNGNTDIDDADVDEDDQAAVSQKRERRTELTDEEFLKQKEGYEAKVESGDIWKELLTWTSPFTPSPAFLSNVAASDTAVTESPEVFEGNEEPEKQKLDKKQHQTLQAAIAELYWKAKFEQVVEIVKWARQCYVKDGKFEVQLAKWEAKARARLEKDG